MKEKMTDRQLILKELREEAWRVKVALEVANNRFDNAVEDKLSTDMKGPVTSAISGLNYCEKEFRNFYPRAKEILSSVAKKS